MRRGGGVAQSLLLYSEEKNRHSHHKIIEMKKPPRYWNTEAEIVDLSK